MGRPPRPITREQQALIDEAAAIHRRVLEASELLDARRAAIQEAADAGASYQAIAAALGLTRSTVHRIAQGHQ